MQLVSTQQWGHHQAKKKNWGHENVHALPQKLKKEGKNQN
jgi:hypothetical protein